MKVTALFEGLNGILHSPKKKAPSSIVTSLTTTSTQVTSGSVFIALQGLRHDGHQFINNAIENGAIAVVVKDHKCVPSDFTGYIFVTSNPQLILEQVALKFYSDPGQQLFCVGVTGTNGKTSTVYMIEHFLNAASIPTGVIGTVDHHFLQHIWSTHMTTPDPIALQSRLKDFLDAGAQAAALEVSSHALVQKRADSVPFDVAIFTNLTRDHLDYHGDVLSYFYAKSRLFTELLAQSYKKHKLALLCNDDSWINQLPALDRSITTWTFGSSFKSDFRYQILDMKSSGTKFQLSHPWGTDLFEIPLTGEYNVKNAITAVATGLFKNIPLAKLQEVAPRFQGIPGRLQKCSGPDGLADKHVFIDYAHTPDALERVLATLHQVKIKSAFPKACLWVIFGCGGDRDKGKRPLMGKIASQYADRVILTSDNPRSEDPMAIINEIAAGLETNSTQQFEKIISRPEAIAYALEHSSENDFILIAGKGHETTQTIGTEIISMSDLELVNGFFKLATNKDNPI